MLQAINANKFTGVMSGIAVIVGRFFPAPLGIEGFFYYGLAVVGALIGVFIANKSNNKDTHIKVLAIFLTIILCGFFYMYFLNTVRTPGLIILMLEGVFFTLFASAFFCAARLVDLSSK